MTAAEWGTLIPAVVALATALGAWLRAQAAHSRIDNLPTVPPPPSAPAGLAPKEPTS